MWPCFSIYLSICMWLSLSLPSSKHMWLSLQLGLSMCLSLQLGLSMWLFIGLGMWLSFGLSRWLSLAQGIWLSLGLGLSMWVFIGLGIWLDTCAHLSIKTATTRHICTSHTCISMLIVPSIASEGACHQLILQYRRTVACCTETRCIYHSPNTIRRWLRTACQT